jgi:transcriptional regulator with XRE-family HTH domain
MDREQEEFVQRITALYVEEVRSGQRPVISDYLARYPQYADEIADFVAYYHAFEVDLPDETRNIPVLSGQFQGAVDTAWERVVPSQIQTANTITSLLGAARKRHLTVSQLAEGLGLSDDILAKLEQRAINATTIPGELIKLLADVLQEPSSAVQGFFGISQRYQRHQVHQVHQVAEAQAMYHMDGEAQSFREAIEESALLSEEQRRAWITIMNREDIEKR